MAYAVRTLVCEVCGKEYTKRCPPDNRFCGFGCSLVYSFEVADQIKHKSGPHYEHWRQQVKECQSRYAHGYQIASERARWAYKDWADRI